jgi:diaminohydroxyphosphoribosylaminopyrimidine deaminase / 5-amino-6-(5-phosphoribosylamino)uracil reductase
MPVGPGGAVPFGDAEDRVWLARAVALAETARGRTSPNPAVGCVLVHGTRIAGEGATQPVGGPHAEAVALAEAGATARGATAYVTLEPCAHQGRTPPCADALLAAGVRRVVIGHPDPNPVAAGGAASLRAGGCEVVGPPQPGELLREAIAQQLEGFLSLVRHDRPHVTLKLAQTPDGELHASDGARWITGPSARRAVHRWRAAVDGVLVGSGTVLTDDPRLTVRDDRDRPVRDQPRPIVLDGRLRLPVDAAIVGRGALVITSRAADPQRQDDLRRAGASVETVTSGPGGGLDLPSALQRIARAGIASVLAEPGRTLAQALMDADLVDRLVLHVGGSRPGTVVVPAVHPASAAAWRLERLGGAGPDLIAHLVRDRGSAGGNPSP